MNKQIKTAVFALPLCIIALSLSSCNKNFNTDPDSPNTVTITDNNFGYTSFYSRGGKTVLPVSYTSSGPDASFNGVDVIVNHEGSDYNIQIATGTESPILLNLNSAPHAGKTGTYNVLTADADLNVYIQDKPTRQAWKCVGGTIDVTTLEPNKVKGTFSLNLVSSSLSKTVTGTFDANQPVVRL